jgi:hypothetical protein
MAALPTFIKTWNFAGINTRIPFVTVADAAASLLFGIKTYLVTTMVAPLVASSNGTTGPSTPSTLLSAGDATDRILAKANCTTRGTVAAAAQSWFCVTWAGVQLMFEYQATGVSPTGDDIFRIAYSPGNLYTSQATTTFAPTATDEVVISTGVTIVNATASADRVYSIQATTDRTIFRLWVYRANLLASSSGLEKFTEAPGIPVGTTLGWNSLAPTTGSNNLAAALGSHGGAASGVGGAVNSFVAQIGGTNRVCSGGTICFSGTSSNLPLVGSLTGSSPIWPILIVGILANNHGWFGTRIDGFYQSSDSSTIPLEGSVADDVVANTRLIWAGTMLTPWLTTAGLVRS